VTVVQSKGDLEEDVPDLVFVQGLAGALGFADEGAEVAGCTVLKNINYIPVETGN
jgi:hypothetical protein